MNTLSADQRALVETHMHVVGYHVTEMLQRVPPQVTRDELASAGYLALVQTALSYDESSGVPFPRYAAIRIKGALVDELRSMDWVSRGARRKIREYAKTVEVMTANLGRAPSRDEIAASLGIVTSEVDAIRDTAETKVLSYDAYDGSLAISVPANAPTPEAEVLMSERMLYLRSAIEVLPERLRYVVEETYFRDRMVTDLAEELGLTQSRVSQLRAEAIALLRDGLNNHLAPEVKREEGVKQGAAARRRQEYYAEIGRKVESNVNAVRSARATGSVALQQLAASAASTPAAHAQVAVSSLSG
ncbi:sigma-70 family RNA polymerase sigma factor [Timonella senegalensis]|uniref:sigma-70 family RNA polymerase sigma factor n=1 Tax=Timonella senegalensis TaxID=1465825 RepID=UPI002FDCF377